MQKTIVTPRVLRGEVTPPPSKSAAHRAVICASLAKGKSVVTPRAASEDIEATIGAMRTLGAEIEEKNDRLEIDGTRTLKALSGSVDCHESGSTLRFLIPVAAAGGGNFTFTGRGRLPLRPIGPYLDCLPRAGVDFTTSGGLPLQVSGKLIPGVFELPGNISSQFITGLLLALPLLGGDSVIRLSTPLESAGYIDLTLNILKRFGVSAEKAGDGYRIPGNQVYRPQKFEVECDWSQAAFWLTAGALGNGVTCPGINKESRQGDREIAGLLKRFGADIRFGENEISAFPGALHGIEIDASQIPDLVPILAAFACFAQGRTVIRNAARLRIKESDRLKTITSGLRAFGARITELEDGLIIVGGRPLSGGTADGAGDHRIVMALSIAAAYCKNPSTITGTDCIAKSYPDFYTDFEKLGGTANVIHLG